MSDAILKWLCGDDTGQSSKALAVAAMGTVTPQARTRYPSDGSDFGRCHRLIEQCPGARAGLDKLQAEGGPYWAALVPRWDEITAVYVAEITRGRGRGDQSTYDLMTSILRPIEATDRGVVRMSDGVSIRFGA